jgi:hypothetical protein
MKKDNVVERAHTELDCGKEKGVRSISRLGYRD